MKGMYADDAAFDKMLEGGNDPLVYEFYEMGAPELPGDLAFGTSITYPGKVGDEYFMTDVYKRQRFCRSIIMITNENKQSQIKT